MSKEMIVSVNGREKKIAIIENGLVTEFYIERGEDEEGIVGNIYKGRVMRVLPGMQSAFVDIGLDRDAFLYVSDFFDEEEDTDAVAVADKATPEIAAAGRSGNGYDNARPSRQERPERSERSASSTSSRHDPRPNQKPEIARASTPPVNAPAQDESEIASEETPAVITPATSNAPNERDARQTPNRDNRRGGRRDRNERGERGERGRRDEPRSIAPNVEARFDETTLDESSDAIVESSSDKSAKQIEMPRLKPEDFDTPFVKTADSFHRIVDEEEERAEEGSMLKDAMLQERLTNQIRRIEFEMEATPAIEIGALLGSSDANQTASFERISDDEAQESQPVSRSSLNASPIVTLPARGGFDEANDIAAPSSVNFERISDDNAPVSSSETTRAAAIQADQTSETPPNKSRSRRGRSTPRTTTSAPVKESQMQTALLDTSIEDTATEDQNAAPKKRRSASNSTATSKAATKKSSATKSTASRSRRAAKNIDDATKDANAEPLTDGEASLRAKPSRGEFATRRRRRGSRRPSIDVTSEQEAEAFGNDSDVTETTIEPNITASDITGNISNGVADNVTVNEDAPPLATEIISNADDDNQNAMPTASNERFATQDGDATKDSVNRDAPRNDMRNDNRQRQPRDNKDGRDARDTRSRNDNRDSRDNARNRNDRRPAPLGISDMLREGQEIIVQIAKEPISQKGARITSHIALPGRYLVYMPTVEHVGVSRKIESDSERQRLRKLITAIRKEEDVPSGGFIVRTAGTNITDQDLREDARYLVRTWRDIKRSSERVKAPALAHQDLDLVKRILRDHLSDEFTAIRVDSEDEYLECVEFINRIQPRLVNRVKLYTRDEPILDAYGVQAEIDKAIKPRVWLKSGGYLVINQTEALVAIDVNTGKFVGRGGSRLEDTITKTNLEAVDEIARQIRLRDLGGIIVLDLIDMEERRNRARVMQALQEALEHDKSPTKVLSFNDFGLAIMTRKRVKQSLERTLCTPCGYCQGAGLIKSPQTIAYEILEESRRLARDTNGEHKGTTLRIHPEVARALRSTERDVLNVIEDYLGAVDITMDDHIHQEQFDFAFA